MTPAATREAEDLEVGSGPAVLLVEDSPDHRLLMATRLTTAGFSVTAVSSGEEAVPLLADFQVVVVDQGLPRMSGLDLLDIVLAVEDGPAAIVVTAGNSTELIVEAMRRGAVDFVTKDSAYLDTVPAVVARAHRQHDLARRTHELQRLALLVHQAEGTEGTMREITDGARRLLRAAACGLAVPAPGGGWELQARSGPSAALEATVAGQEGARATGWSTPVRLAVDVPLGAGDRPAVLLVDRPARGLFSDDERELASAFAGLAATALQRARQGELEHGLVRELSRTLQVREDILASVSHELRTPLTAITGFAEILLARLTTLDPATVEGHLSRIVNNAHRLRALVDELLEVSRVTHGDLPIVALEPVTVADTVREVLANESRWVGSRHVAVDLDSVVVTGDSELLLRVLTHLVVNACKYSEPDSSITIRAVRGGDRTRIEVIDEGVGLDLRDQQQAFEPFFRAPHATENAIAGTGLGLALVRSHVEAMGGTVGVTSVLGAGSTFWLTLPNA